VRVSFWQKRGKWLISGDSNHTKFYVLVETFAFAFLCTICFAKKQLFSDALNNKCLLVNQG